MKHKLLMRNLSISAPKMTIKRQLPWPVRIIFWALPAALCAALLYGAYETGRRLSAPGMEPVVQSLRRDGASESREKMARAAENSLNEQIKVLEAENARLKEELAYFNNILPANTGEAGVTIQGLALEPVAPNQLRFRTLVMQGGNGKQRFSGQLQFVVTAQRGTETVNFVFPSDQSSDRDKFKIGFRHFQRLEGNLALPDGATVKLVQARIMENGQVRAQKMMEPYLPGNRNS